MSLRTVLGEILRSVLISEKGTLINLWYLPQAQKRKRLVIPMPCPRTSLVAQTVKCLSTMRETRVRSLGQEDPLEKEMAPHSSTIAWKIPWTEEPGRLQSMGSQRVGHDWVTSLSLWLSGMIASVLYLAETLTPLHGNVAQLYCEFSLSIPKCVVLISGLTPCYTKQ